ncbi:hypothetical protein [Staphylococcus saprophyticus]|uniref:hypothetical protein n=1 Tax=Staphylococcus saprophyticus TaxID=29385 RepID=UPI0037048A49
MTNPPHHSLPIFKLPHHPPTISLLHILKTPPQFPPHFNITQSDHYLLSPHQQPHYPLTLFKPHKLTPNIQILHNQQTPPQPLSVHFLT